MSTTTKKPKTQLPSSSTGGGLYLFVQESVEPFINTFRVHAASEEEARQMVQSYKDDTLDRDGVVAFHRSRLRGARYGELKLVYGRELEVATKGK